MHVNYATGKVSIGRIAEMICETLLHFENYLHLSS